MGRYSGPGTTAIFVAAGVSSAMATKHATTAKVRTNPRFTIDNARNLEITNSIAFFMGHLLGVPLRTTLICFLARCRGYRSPSMPAVLANRLAWPLFPKSIVLSRTQPLVILVLLCLV